ncbi:MAG: hypothetical protein OIF35_06365, partial [Cellvibrionaceae bacterium]|nr:hypothetical protein [Cellvibrionaceae bacterium]
MKTLKIVTGSMLLLCLGLVLVFYWGSRDEAEYQDLGLINDAHLDQQVQLAGLEFLLDRQFKVFQFAEGDSDKGEPLADSLQQSHLYKLLKPGYWARPAALAFRQQGEPYLPALLESLQASHWRFPPSPAPGISDYSIGGLMQLLDLLILETRWYLNEAKTSADIDKALDYYLAATELGLKLGESGDWTTDSLAVARYGLNKAELLLPELTPHLSTRQLRQLLANFEQQSPRLNQIYQQRFGYALVEYRRVLAFWRDEVEEQNPVAVFIARLLRPYHLHPKRSFNLYAKVLKQLQQYDYG